MRGSLSFLSLSAVQIYDSRHVQPSNQKIYLSWELHKCHVQSSLQVKNYIMLLAPISYFSFKFQWIEIPILATLCAPWKKTFPLWRTGVGYVGALFIPHACLQLGGYNSRHSIRGGSPITSKVSVSQSPLNSHKRQSR